MRAIEHPIAPIPVRPWTLNGISERLLVAHYENIYGGTVRTLNALRRELEGLTTQTPPHHLRMLKREELAAANSVILHELYFGSIGGEGNKVPDAIAGALEEHFSSVAAWRREFTDAAKSLGGRSGWVWLTYSRTDQRLCNHIALNDTETAIDAAPLLVLDLYEHAYHLDFGANVVAYVEAFMRNINWQAVIERMEAVRAGHPLPDENPVDKSLPSISVEELAAQLATGENVQILDARPRHYVSRSIDQMKGAEWRDPDQVEIWADQLSREQPVAVYCAYGFHVGCNVTRALRERGFDARFIRGGVSAWYAGGGPRTLKPPAE